LWDDNPPLPPMPIRPTLDQFMDVSHPVPILKRLEGPKWTPETAFERLAESPFAFLLESVKGSPETARYSFVGADPFLVLKSRGNRVEVIRGRERKVVIGDPLAVCRDWLGRYSIPPPGDAPPFIGGAVGFLSYDLVQLFEKLPKPASEEGESPDLYLLWVDTLLAFDHLNHVAEWIHCPPADRFRKGDRKVLYEEGLQKIAAMERRLNTPSRATPRPPKVISDHVPRSNFSKDGYKKMIEACKEYIAAGDIYQANLSQRLVVEGETDPWGLYKNLRAINPSPFSAFLKMEDICLASASPERLVRVAGGIVETRPIAGTRPRGKSPAEDLATARALLGNEKEAAEHIMLVDLERNDLGRISRYGSVAVNELMITEQYSHVIHIVSNIRGVLAPGKDCFDVIRAVFPGGTITGVPKIRCMEIIAELEPVCRGPYSGSIGYLSFSGTMDLNIIIRTFVIARGRTHIQVGGGIVADSDPEKEYQETLYKAEAMLKALRGET
jgi:anthranilate/para-aminobenzoate synthase component I